MKTTEYERTYEVVKNAIHSSRDVNEVADFLAKANKTMTCREIGIAVYGEFKYTKSRDSRRLSSHLGKILAHLNKGGYVKINKIDGEPIEYEEDVWVNNDGCPYIIKVHDDEGNTYEIPNPNFKGDYSNGHYETVIKTFIPKVKVYTWVG